MQYTTSAQCPWCGELIELWIEPQEQASEYSEDCAVCCRPIRLQVAAEHEGGALRVEQE